MTLTVNATNINKQIERLQQTANLFKQLDDTTAQDNANLLQNIIEQLEDEQSIMATINKVNALGERFNTMGQNITGDNEERIIDLLMDMKDELDSIKGKSNSEGVNETIDYGLRQVNAQLAVIENHQNSGGLLMTEDNQQSLAKIKGLLDELGIPYE